MSGKISTRGANRSRPKSSFGLMDIEGIGGYYLERLNEGGIPSLDALRRMGVIEMRKRTGIGLRLLRKWQAAAILMQIPGVDGQVAEVWAAAGIRDVRTVATADSLSLYAILEDARNPKSARNKIPDNYGRVITPYRVDEWKRLAYQMCFAPDEDTPPVVYPAPLPDWIPAHESNYGPNPNNRDVRYVVMHAMDGYLTGTIDEFQKDRSNFTTEQLRRDPKRSAHYLVGTLGRVVQMVNDSDIAFHAKTDPPSECDGELGGSGCSGRRSTTQAWSSEPCNCHSIGIELEDKGGYTFDPDWATDELKTAAADLVRSICDHYAIPKDAQHIIRHQDIPFRTSGKQDPGYYWDHDAFIKLVAPEPPPAPRKKKLWSS